ncbi:hypothetical protein BN2497_7063 [Janthinobacterium sp. CG23_2]|nr:hypothetical protein BN2497_7063 [Janthinobacterium sp. CG23_2]CUU29929.1 hypothetical protein BN3177_7063 [Janthinobacterium sp. CG23_2]
MHRQRGFLGSLRILTLRILVLYRRARRRGNKPFAQFVDKTDCQIISSLKG